MPDAASQWARSIEPEMTHRQITQIGAPYIRLPLIRCGPEAGRQASHALRRAALVAFSVNQPIATLPAYRYSAAKAQPRRTTMLMRLLIRWGFALVLVMATYNPTNWNLVRWGMANSADSLPVVVLIALIVLLGWIIYIRATFRSIGPVGIVLVLAVVGALVWVFYDQGWLDVGNATVMTWIGLIALSLVLGIGMTWSIIRRAISGQLDVDEIDE